MNTLLTHAERLLSKEWKQPMEVVIENLAASTQDMDLEDNPKKYGRTTSTPMDAPKTLEEVESPKQRRQRNAMMETNPTTRKHFGDNSRKGTEEGKNLQETPEKLLGKSMDTD